MTARLLLADDDEVLQWAMEESLSQLGYSVDLALDEQEAWEKIASQPDAYDLVLLDKHMPRLDGITLLRRIKTVFSLGMLPVIMLTGDSGSEDIAEGLAAGAYYYLIKPPEQEVLRSIIGNALEDARKQRELRTLVGQHQNSLSLLKRAEFQFQTT